MSDLKPLTRDQILAAVDVQSETVPVPEWGGTVTVRGLTSSDRLRLNTMETDKSEARVNWLVACVFDDKGQPLFTPADVEALSKKSVKAVDRVWDAIARVNGLGAAGVKDAEKN